MNTDVARTETTGVAGGGQGNRGGQIVAMNPARMIELAFEKGAVDQLDKLLALQERWEANEARKAFVRAMNEFNRNKPDVFKNKHVDFPSKGGRTTYDHASLDHICGVLGESLSFVGISFRWRTENLDSGWVRVTCLLTHEQGHSEETTLQGPADQSGGKNAIQAIGSTTEYLRRYTLLSATGVAVKGMDDDGQGGGGEPDPRVQAAAQQRKDTAPQQEQAQNGLTTPQVNALTGAITKAGITPERFCKSASINSLADLDGSRFKGAMQHLSNTADNKAKREQQQ